MQSQSYYLDYQDNHVDGDQTEVLLEGLHVEAFQNKGLDSIKSFALFIKDSEEKVVGGITGITFYGCLHIDILWVQKELRKRGWGTLLIRETEKVGRQRNCQFVTVNTMDWEALPFYQKMGYQIEFIREGYEKNSKMYLLKKWL